MQDLTIYRFGAVTDGAASMKDVLGGKGANLAEMALLGIPVPSGFTLPCELSVRYSSASSDEIPALEMDVWSALSKGMSYIQYAADIDEGSAEYPLVSVRSGARVSMPGMMDTILNVGLTSTTLPRWIDLLGERAAWDCRRRLIQMYSTVVFGMDSSVFEGMLKDARDSRGLKSDSELNAAELKLLAESFLSAVGSAGFEFPDTLVGQLHGAVIAVLKSWNNPRAVEYRKIHKIPNKWGTAVNVQTMVFGNMGDDSATGVLFSRDPSDGTNYVVGEFLVNAQGEDVVAGIRTPSPLALMEAWNEAAFNELLEVVGTLEYHYKEMQDVEFTVQAGKLWILQTRTGKRTPLAAFQIAHDLAQESLITKEMAVSRVNRRQLLQALSDIVDPTYKVKPDLVGIAAGGSVVTGQAVLSAAAAISCTKPCILVTKETNPDDIAGMNASVGILTATGGLTSHAAVVARGMGKSAVVGATDLLVDSSTFSKKTATEWTVFLPGAKVTLDGSTGRVWINKDVPVVSASKNPAIRELVQWAAAEDMVERVTFPLGLGAAEITKKASRLSGVVHIDTATFESRDLTQKLEALGAGLSKSTVTVAYVDVQPIANFFSKADLVIDRMFGSSTNRDEVVKSKLSAMGDWTKAVLSRVVICGAGSTYKGTLKFLIAKGAKVIGSVKSFADLLDATGPLTIEDDVILRVFGTADAYAKAKAMVEASTGKKLDGVGVRPTYWYEFLPDEV